MNNIKIIYFDFEDIDSTSLTQQLKSLCMSVYRVSNNIFMVNYTDTPKTLYSSLGNMIQGKNIFIIEVNSSMDAYWGFMGKELWDWLNNNREK